MANWIHEALQLLEDCSHTSLSTKVCQEQTSILARALVHVCGFLEQIQEVALDLEVTSNQQKFVKIGEEFQRVMCVSSRLLTAYQKDNWVTTALLSEESQEEFKSVLAELYDSVELVSGVLLEVAKHELDKSRVRGAYSSWLTTKNSMSMLELAAVKDRKQMMRMALASEDGEDTSPTATQLQLLCTVLLEKNVPVLDQSQLEFKQHLKQGGHGTVYEACWFKSINVAVKVFTSGDSSFRRELAALASCKHPNILRIYGYAYDPDKKQHSLVMEKMDMDLGDLLARNPRPSPLDSVTLLLEIAKGMAWLHSKDVIHRDLKPQNILISSDRDITDVRIADFGLSRTGFATSRVSEVTSKLGTKVYMAPEVWNSQHYSKKSDVFSFAMVCYQMLAGKLPFEAEVLESSDYMTQVCSGMRPLDSFPESCPVELAELTRRCWSADAAQRPTFFEVCETLKQVKAKLLADVGNWNEVLNKLLASSSTGSSAGYQLSRNFSKFRVESGLLDKLKITTGSSGFTRKIFIVAGAIILVMVVTGVVSSIISFMASKDLLQESMKSFHEMAREFGPNNMFKTEKDYGFVVLADSPGASMSNLDPAIVEAAYKNHE